MRSLRCLRCGKGMKFGMQEKFQMGQAGFFSGDWPHLMAGALELEVWFCPDCGKVEFFTPENRSKAASRPQDDEFDFVGSLVNESIDAVGANGIPQRRCPTCGRNHDFDYPKCPFCKHDYYAK